MIKNILLLGIAVFVLSGCIGGEKKEEWTSWVYPDKNNVKRVSKGNVYKTLGECKDASIAKLKELGFEKSGDYKCGLNCTFHDGMKTEICEKMTK